MEGFLIIGQIGHIVAALTVGWLVLASYRYVRRRSSAVGAIFAMAILVRVTVGLTLFWVSYLELPIAESLQLGGGFWRPALDATGYYQMASDAANARTPVALDHVVPAPIFVNILAFWMLLVGISPVAGMFLNLCLYVALVLLLVRCFDPVDDWRGDLPCIVAVAAYSFWPVVLFNSTQPLKDELFTVLVAVLCLGVLGLRHLVYSAPSTRYRWATAAGAIVVSLATFGIAGIRWYYPIIVWCALALMLCIFAVRGRTTPLPRYVAGCFAVLIVTWLGFWGGAGPHYQLVGANLGAMSDIARLPSDLALMAQVSRAGFLTSGGTTNIVVPLREDSSAGMTRLLELVNQQGMTPVAVERRTAYMLSPEYLEIYRLAMIDQLNRQRKNANPERRQQIELGLAAIAPARAPAAPAPARTVPAAPAPATVAPQPQGLQGLPTNLREEISAAFWGLVILFVPLSLAETLVGVELSGGYGLLSLVSLDTIYADTALALVLTLLWTRRHAIGDRLHFVVFGLILSATTTCLLGYVVTNLGTLWRMRPLIAIPLLVLVVVLSPRAGTPREATGASR